MRAPIREVIVWAVLLLLVYAAVIWASGGITAHVLGVRFTSRDPVRVLALAALLVAAGCAVWGRRAVDAEFAAVAGRCAAAAPVIAAAAVVLTVAAGLYWGTFTAGGADAYAYVSQARLWQQATLRVEQPFVAAIPWPDADAAFAPLGYRRAVTGHAIVPSYAPGLPLLMAAAEAVAGACAAYVVVPVLGGLCIWCCYRLGRRLSSPGAGACAAVVMACSPSFLFHLVAPMSDVPAAAFWSAAMVFALDAKTGRGAALSGTCAALAILIRPNLAPLAAITAACLVWPDAGGKQAPPRWNTVVWFVSAVVPATAAIALLNWHWYGSPLRSGYPDLDAAYAIDHIRLNARRYGAWLIATETPLILLSPAALVASLFVRGHPVATRIGVLFLAFLATVAASYVPYAVFDDWRYLRYFLPAFPILLVTMSTAILALLERVPALVRVAAFVALGAFLLSHQLRFAAGEGLAGLAFVERRYAAVARFIEASTPPRAVFLSLQHAGSVRHYAGRMTVRFDVITVGLDEAMASLKRAGWRPFILLEDWEEPQFKRQFGDASEAGRLAWRPYARLDAPGGANIYDPEQMRDRTHDMLSIPPPSGPDCRHY